MVDFKSFRGLFFNSLVKFISDRYAAIISPTSMSKCKNISAVLKIKATRPTPEGGFWEMPRAFHPIENTQVFLMF